MDTANSDPNANRPSPDDPRHRTPDSHHSEMDDLWSKYKYYIIGVPVAIILVVGIAMWMEVRKEEKFREARQALNAAQTVEELQSVAQEFEGSVMGGEALLLLAGKQQEQEDLPAAMETFSRFTEEYPNHPFISGAFFAMGGLAAEQGEMDRALDFYQQVYDDYPMSYAAKFAREAAARIEAEQGNVEAALALMEPILEAQKSQQERMRVEMQMGFLTRMNEPLSDIPDPEPDEPAEGEDPGDIFRDVLPGLEGEGNTLNLQGRQTIEGTQVFDGQELTPEQFDQLPKLGNPMFDVEVEGAEQGTPAALDAGEAETEAAEPTTEENQPEQAEAEPGADTETDASGEEPAETESP
jgi:tetratricopeptide (TPR) repeat protein